MQTSLSLAELKGKSPADLLSIAEELEIENASTMRKGDMMFCIPGLEFRIPSHLRSLLGTVRPVPGQGRHQHNQHPHMSPVVRQVGLS